MFIFGVGCPQMGCLGQIRMDCRDSTDVLQEIQSVCHVPNTSKYIWSNVVKNSLLKSSSNVCSSLYDKQNSEMRVVVLTDEALKCPNHKT